jgi:hypothetical protein
VAMKRWLAMAALCAVLLSTPVWGQRGGRGGMPAGGAGRGGFVSHGGGGFGHGPVGVGAPIGWGGRHPPFGHPYHYPFYPGRYPWGWGYPWVFGYGYGSYAYPGWGLSVGFGDSDSYSYPAQPPPAYDYAYPDNSSAYAQNSQIQQDEIDRLSHEVDRLRESREAESALPPPQPKAQVHAETVLVFGDKHTEEIQNYAVVGNTLWVFTELRARKIPIANLDVPATTRANDDRGVDFRLPK